MKIKVNHKPLFCLCNKAFPAFRGQQRALTLKGRQKKKQNTSFPVFSNSYMNADLRSVFSVSNVPV